MKTYTVYKNELEMTLYSQQTLELYLKNGWSLKKHKAIVIKEKTNGKKKY